MSIPATPSAAIESPAPTQTPSGQAVAESVDAAKDFKEVVSAKSSTAGDIVEIMDQFAFEAGTFRISAWDVVVVACVIVAVFLFAWLFSKAAHAMLNRVTRFDDAQRLLAEKLISLVIWVVAILIGIDLLGIDLTALAVFSGAFGLAIGFGLQKTFGNLIAGIILLMDRSIKPGDVIAIADQAGNETFGQIRKIGIRAISMTTRDEREYLIPNENLMINQVENWSYSSRNVRIQVRVGISYEADIGRAEELMLEAAAACERVLADPAPRVWLDAYGDSSVDFVIHCWISDPEEGVGNVRSDVLKRLWWLLKDNGIEIPFPQRDLNLKGNKQFQELVAALRSEPQDKG